MTKFSCLFSHIVGTIYFAISACYVEDKALSLSQAGLAGFILYGLMHHTFLYRGGKYKTEKGND